MISLRRLTMPSVKELICVCLVLLFSVPSWAATIISPTQDQTVIAGSTIDIVVKADAGEQWQGFALGFKALEYDSANNLYKISIQVPNDVLGYRDDLRIIGVDNNNNEVELNRRVFVKLPTNVVLQSITVGEDLMVLYLAPPDSSPEDKQMIETDQVSVAGVYSDGVSRLITSSAFGTTYASSDEKIVTVDSEGKLTAKGLGRAAITVKNGKYSATVKLVVRPYYQ
jgi:hypothetical protein